MANKYQLKAAALPWATALGRNPHFTEQLQNSLVASLSALQRLQGGEMEDKALLCVNASLRTLQGLLQQLDNLDEPE